MTKFKKATYFDAYIYTNSVMHYKVEEKDNLYSVEAVIETRDKSKYPLDNVREDVYNVITNLKFEDIKVSCFDDCIVINGNDNKITVREDCILIPEVLTVFKGNKECTQQVDINGITCMKYESNNYNFYVYNGNVIKISKNYNVNDFIQLKSID